MDALDISVSLRRKGYTQTAAAKLLGVPPATVNGVIHGDTKSRRTAEFIAAIIGHSVETLWPGKYNYKPRTRSRVPLPRIGA